MKPMNWISATGRSPWAAQDPLGAEAPVQAHMAHTLDEHLQPIQVAASQLQPHRGLDPVAHPRRGVGRGVSTPAAFRGGAPHMTGAPGDKVHLRDPGAAGDRVGVAVYPRAVRPAVTSPAPHGVILFRDGTRPGNVRRWGL